MTGSPGQAARVEMTPGDARWMIFVSLLFGIGGGVAFIAVPNLLGSKKWPFWRREHAALSALTGLVAVAAMIVTAPVMGIVFVTLFLAGSGSPLSQGQPPPVLVVVMTMLFMIVPGLIVVQSLLGPRRRREGQEVFFLLPKGLKKWYLGKVGANRWPGAPAVP
jgi:MFS family permease